MLTDFSLGFIINQFRRPLQQRNSKENNTKNDKQKHKRTKKNVQQKIFPYAAHCLRFFLPYVFQFCLCNNLKNKNKNTNSKKNKK